jgi:ketol-acid reductoisomerase
MVGAGVRERYLSGEGFISFVGVERNTSGTAWETVLAVAKGAGSLKAGALGLTFEQETELDLFVQQGFMSILYGLLNTVGALLVEKGYPPEAVATELYLSGELAYIFEKAAEVGLIEQAQVHSLTNQYGLLSRYERVGEPKLQRQLTAILDQIRSGAFAQDWASEYLNGYPNLRDYLETLADWPIAGLEARAFRMLAGRSRSALDDEDTQRRR